VTDSGFNPKARRSLAALIGELPGQIGALVSAELATFKAEMAGKAKNFGLGAALFVVAAVLLFFAVAVFIATAIIALSLVLQLWLAALIVGVALLVIAVILALIGVNRVKKATETDPNGVRGSIRQDVDALKGVGSYDN
jgi:VIT1/CCC1 family predicted Fe2+/Mn2+ transporter